MPIATDSIHAAEDKIVVLAFEENPFVIAANLHQCFPDAKISCSDDLIQITKISPISGQEITTGWNQLANDPSTNAVMIATALTSAESWMVLFPNLMTKLQAEWKKQKKSK